MTGVPTGRPDPAGIIAAVLPGEPDKVLAVLDELRSAGCLRTVSADWPPIPDDALTVSDVRLVDYMTPEGEGRFSIRHDGGMTVIQLLGLFDLAKEQVLAGWRGSYPQ